MIKWFDSQNKRSDNSYKWMQERIYEAYQCRKHTTEGNKRTKKLETKADKPKLGDNVQNRQLRTWLSEVEYVQLDALRRETLALRSEIKE